MHKLFDLSGKVALPLACDMTKWQEIVGTIHFLASAASSYVTAQTLAVDGGAT